MDAEKLKTPPTEIEIAEVLNAVACLEQVHDVIRRLVFQRDELQERVNTYESYAMDRFWDE